MSFELDPQLQADTVAVADIDLSTVRLMNDRRFPWLILVPRFEGLVELTDLSHGDCYRLMDNIRLISNVLQSLFPDADKLNVGALGNAVRQLHVHVIVRRTSDVAWPKPVWGVGTAQCYKDDELDALVQRLREAFETSAG